jgi:hypothetical protein
VKSEPSVLLFTSVQKPLQIAISSRIVYVGQEVELC